MSFKLINDNVLNVLPTIESESMDAIITDPPYPCVEKSYGVMKEEEWMEMMMEVVKQSKRIVKPTGSAVFLLQPTGVHVGQMRTWLYEFIFKAAKEWNLVQDVIWFNPTATTNQWCNKKNGLLRPSVKYCIWLGNPDCYRDQSKVMWQASESSLAKKTEERCMTVIRDSGYTINDHRMKQSVDAEQLATPYNIIICNNTQKKMPSDKQNRLPKEKNYPHPAKTPEMIAHWWLHYICPEKGKVFDPFSGVATIGRATLKQQKEYLGIEVLEKFYIMGMERLTKTQEIYGHK
jgi:DNA modification methylase